MRGRVCLSDRNVAARQSQPANIVRTDGQCLSVGTAVVLGVGRDRKGVRARINVVGAVGGTRICEARHGAGVRHLRHERAAQEQCQERHSHTTRVLAGSRCRPLVWRCVSICG